MQHRMGDFWFRLMALEYRIRSRPSSVLRELDEAGVRRGMRVLDFGCGPGRFTLPVARIVGSEGKVFAVDIHPLARLAVQKAAYRDGLTNIEVIDSDCATGLGPQSVDVVLLYDTLHDVMDKGAVLRELRRILGPVGRISYKDHTLWGEPLLALMRGNGFFPVEQELRSALVRKMLTLRGA